METRRPIEWVEEEGSPHVSMPKKAHLSLPQDQVHRHHKLPCALNQAQPPSPKLPPLCAVFQAPCGTMNPAPLRPVPYLSHHTPGCHVLANTYLPDFTFSERKASLAFITGHSVILEQRWGIPSLQAIECW